MLFASLNSYEIHTKLDHKIHTKLDKIRKKLWDKRKSCKVIKCYPTDRKQHTAINKVNSTHCMVKMEFHKDSPWATPLFIAY